MIDLRRNSSKVIINSNTDTENLQSYLFQSYLFSLKHHIQQMTVVITWCTEPNSSGTSFSKMLMFFWYVEGIFVINGFVSSV